jgi:hypothetical protein
MSDLSRERKMVDARTKIYRRADRGKNPRRIALLVPRA